MFKTKLLALMAIVAVACGQAEGVERQEPRSVAGDIVLLDTATGIEAVSLQTGRVERRVSEGVVPPGAEEIVTTRFDGAATHVTRTAVAGNVLSSAVVEGDFLARIVTEDLIALTARTGAGETPYLPAPKEETHMVVLESDGTQRDFVLEGNFEPEAFRLDGSELFVIEYLPAIAPDRYRVRRLKLRNGAVVPIGPLKLNAPDQMRGTGRSQVLAPGRHELYTLYTHQPEAGHSGAEHGPGGHAFVHVLNLDQAWAHCIDLPRVFASSDTTASAIAVNTSGSRVYVADWTSGAIAVLNPRRVRVTAFENGFEFGTADDDTFAAASESRLYIAGGASVVVLDAGSLKVLDRWSTDGEVTGLSLVDGRLFVATPNGLAVLNPITGRLLTSVSTDVATGIHGVDLND